MLYNKVMAIQPDTDLYLLKCPIESDQRNQLTFSTRSAQETYFKSLPKIALDDFSYQRKDNYIRVPAHIDDIIGYNYVMYKNKNYTSRWFYAFITRMEYVSDKCTNVYIKTDVYQTWALDISVKNCYVEREHVNDDTVGAHTIPEGLDTGEYICNDVIDYIYADPETVTGAAAAADFMVCAQVTTLKFSDSIYFDGPTYNIQNSVPQGCYIIAWPLSKYSASAMWTLTGMYDGVGKGDAIISMFIVPKALAANWVLYTGHGGLIENNNTYYYPQDTHGGIYIDGYNTSGAMTDLRVTRNTTLDGYTPKNNKLFVAPYNYFTISNNQGSDIEYYYEDFYPFDGNAAGTPVFSVQGSFEQGGSIFCYPENSKHTGNPSSTMNDMGWSEGIAGAKLPMLSWTSDYYLNWEAQNGKNIAIQTGLQAASWATGVIGGITGAASQNWNMRESAVSRGYLPDEEEMVSAGGAGLVGSVFSFASQVANTQNAIRKAKMVPPQSKGTQAVATLTFASGNSSKFTARKMSVRAEFAAQIDGYFSMFGYKVNTNKIPNFTGRLNWNYVKTIGFNCEGDVPQGDLQEYKNIFDNGVTLWHNPSTFMDYSQNNNIV